MSTFGDFVRTYASTHSLSINDLAKQMEVPHSTVARWANGRTEPSLKHLVKLSRTTATDICALVYMIYPDARPTRSAEMQRLADDIGKLPPDMQQLVDSLIVGMVVKQSTDNTNKG